MPGPAKPAFYPSAKEAKRAEKYRNTISGPVIMWALDGSAVHKHWPFTHNAMARILLETDYHIVTVGNAVSVFLEGGWEDEPRVVRTSDKWSIRKTLSFLPHCDMVIGPETGVLNAAGALDMPKIVFLSHSSATNFSLDYNNMHTLAPAPEDCPCYPCHKMIYGWESCVRDDTGALCQTQISLDAFWETFLRVSENREIKKETGHGLHRNRKKV